MHMFKKVLIANRGEIACRIARTCRRLGIAVATVHSEADRGALHVREVGESIELGPAAASASYLVIDKIVAAARRVGADAVHPGYGFLAENAGFAFALEQARIAFIGPAPEILERFGDKAAAKAEARAAKIPVVAGSETPTDSVDEIVAIVERMQLPVLLKAAAGGGGKGMRVVHSKGALRSEAEAAMREGRGAFGDARLIVEEYLPQARHIEVQILGDGRGNVIHLFDRECSLQRRHQKVIEEAPVGSLSPDRRNALMRDAVRLGRAVAYRGLGTVEFIVSGDRSYFLEVNPRIQVEHPVTEEVTGLDLIELQIRAVAEGRLPIAQAEVRTNGVAVEARVYAEDPANNFLPSTGRIEALQLPNNLRIDAGVDTHMEITPYYDPMIAKLIATGSDRDAAYQRLEAALADTAVLGVATNVGFLRKLVADAKVRANDIHTGTIDAIVSDSAPSAPPAGDDIAIAAALWLRSRRIAGGNDVWVGWSELAGWRQGVGVAAVANAPAVRLRADSWTHDIRFGAIAPGELMPIMIGEETKTVGVRARPDGTAIVSVDGRTLSVRPTTSDDQAGFLRDGHAVRFAVEAYLSGALLVREGIGDGRVRAPMMGRMVSLHVEQGQVVAAGERLAVMESMKMELALNAPIDGTVREIGCRIDTTVERDQVVFVIAAASGEAAA